MSSRAARLSDLVQEIRRIGPTAAAIRASRLIGDRLRVYRLRQPVRPAASALAGAEPPALDAWRTGDARFFLERPDAVRAFLRSALPPAEQERVAMLGREASHGRIRAFRAWPADFGEPVDWLLNPVTGARWPDVHSREVLNGRSRARVGDIKYTWEAGRFLHVCDVLRAWLLTDDRALLERLLAQIASFDAANPIHRGPHWISEQEVAIRGCMFALLLHALRHDDALGPAEYRLLVRQIAAAADFCAHELSLARYAIDNNHLIAGALGLYVAGCVLPWHPHAARWHDQGRREIRGALARQWYPDGGFVQPSHNYHRLACGYLLWAFRLAELREDRAFATEIRERLAASLRFLGAMTMAADGRLPNWGPNDGALFAPLTSCEFRDYRPLLTSLARAAGADAPFGPGPWDEESVWLRGATSADATVAGATSAGASSAPGAASPSAIRQPSSSERFPYAGLHLLRDDDAGALAVLRAGPVLSRFGQQAGQLHVDLTWRRRNVLVDVGTYSYADARMHEWTRSTDAHNTVVVDGASQMRPHRQFLFLDWPDAGSVELPAAPAGVRGWHAGWHSGYRRHTRDVRHARLLAELEGPLWLVVDRLRAGRPGAPVPVDLRWHFCPARATLEDGRVELALPEGGFALRWFARSEPAATLVEGQDDPPDGWVSDHYGERSAAPSLHLRWPLADELVLVTLAGEVDRVRGARVELDARSARVAGAVIPLDFDGPGDA